MTEIHGCKVVKFQKREREREREREKPIHVTPQRTLSVSNRWLFHPEYSSIVNLCPVRYVPSSRCSFSWCLSRRIGPSLPTIGILIPRTSSFVSTPRSIGWRPESSACCASTPERFGRSRPTFSDDGTIFWSSRLHRPSACGMLTTGDFVSLHQRFVIEKSKEILKDEQRNFFNFRNCTVTRTKFVSIWSKYVEYHPDFIEIFKL